MKVVKFGGSSLADAKQIKKVCSIILSDSQRRIVVVSAPGKRYDTDTKVTDLLIRLAKACQEGSGVEAALEAVLERYAGIAKDLNLGREIVCTIKNDLISRMHTNCRNYEMFEDLMKAAGEDQFRKADRLLSAKHRRKCGIYRSEGGGDVFEQRIWKRSGASPFL